MTTHLREGGIDWKNHGFLSSHRCPEADLIIKRSETEGDLVHNPQKEDRPKTRQDSCHMDEQLNENVENEDNRLHKAGHVNENPVSATNNHYCEADYLDMYNSSCRSSSQPSDGSMSEWSDEDLSPYFSPSVILPSNGHEESIIADSETSSFECIEMAMENQVREQERKGSRMVPKRQIQLRRRDTCDLQEHSEDKPEVSIEALCSPRHRHEVLLRQHSTPANINLHTADPEEVDPRIVKGSKGSTEVDHNPRQRFQKSISLDETKAKMASCIIKSVLFKKMQVELNMNSEDAKENSLNPSEGFKSSGKNKTKKTLQGPEKINTKYRTLNNQKGSHSKFVQYYQGVNSKTQQKTLYRQNSVSLLDSTGAPSSGPTGNTETVPGEKEREKVKEGKSEIVRGGGEGGELKFPGCSEGNVHAGGQGIFKAVGPVHVVRDVRSLVKNTYNMPFKDTTAADLQNGQKDSPPLSYQQALSHVQGNFGNRIKGQGYRHVKHPTERRESQSSPLEGNVTEPAARGCVTKTTADLYQPQGKITLNSGSIQPHNGRITQQPTAKHVERRDSLSTSNANVKEVCDYVRSTDMDPASKPPMIGQLSDIHSQSQNETAGIHNTLHRASQITSTNRATSVPTCFSTEGYSYKPETLNTIRSYSQGPNTTPQPQGRTTILSFPHPSPANCVLSPGPPQTLLSPYVYTPSPLAGYPTLQPQMGKLSYIQTPFLFHSVPQSPPQPRVQLRSQVQSESSNAPLLRRAPSEETQDRTDPESMSHPTDGYKGFIKYCTPQTAPGKGDSGKKRASMETQQKQPHTQEQLTQIQEQKQEPQQTQQPPFLCGVQSFLPAHAAKEFQRGSAGIGHPQMTSAMAIGGLYSHAPPHMLLDPQSGQCFYMDIPPPPPQPQLKVLFDPETGHYVEVYLPQQPVPKTTATMLSQGCAAMHFPGLHFPAMYASNCIPFHVQPQDLTHRSAAP